MENYRKRGKPENLVIRKMTRRKVKDIETRYDLYRWQKSLPSVRMSGIFDAQLTRNFLAFFLDSRRANPGNGVSFDEEIRCRASRRSNLFLSPWNRMIPLGFHLNGDDSKRKRLSWLERFNSLVSTNNSCITNSKLSL